MIFLLKIHNHALTNPTGRYLVITVGINRRTGYKYPGMVVGADQTPAIM